MFVAILQFTSASNWITDYEVGIENKFAKIVIYPHTSNELITQTQYMNLTSNISIAKALNVTFLYDRKDIQNGHIYLQDTWNHSRGLTTITVPSDCSNNVSIWNEELQRNETYYALMECTRYQTIEVYENYTDWKNIDYLFRTDTNSTHKAHTILNAVWQPYETKTIKLTYDVPARSKGKYSVYAYIGSPVQLLLGTANIIIDLDPWWGNTTWTTYHQYNVTNPNATAIPTNYYRNFTLWNNETYPEMRVTNNASGTDQECSSWWKVEDQIAPNDKDWIVNCTEVYGENNYKFWTGNESAVIDKSNISRACRFGDSFTDTNLDLTKWNISGTPQIVGADDTLQLDANEIAQTKMNFSNNTVLLTSVMLELDPVGDKYYVFGFINNLAGEIPSQLDWWVNASGIGADTVYQTRSYNYLLGTTITQKTTTIQMPQFFSSLKIERNKGRADFYINNTIPTNGTIIASLSDVNMSAGFATNNFPGYIVSRFVCVYDDMGGFGYNSTVTPPTEATYGSQPYVIINSPSNNSDIGNASNFSIKYTAYDTVSNNLTTSVWVNNVLDRENNSVANNTQINETVGNTVLLFVGKNLINVSIATQTGQINSTLIDVYRYGLNLSTLLFSADPLTYQSNQSINTTINATGGFAVSAVNATIYYSNGTNETWVMSLISGTNQSGVWQNSTIILKNILGITNVNVSAYTNATSGYNETRSGTFTISAVPVSGGGGGATPPPEEEEEEPEPEVPVTQPTTDEIASGSSFEPSTQTNPPVIPFLGETAPLKQITCEPAISKALRFKGAVYLDIFNCEYRGILNLYLKRLGTGSILSMWAVVFMLVTVFALDYFVTSKAKEKSNLRYTMGFIFGSIILYTVVQGIDITIFVLTSLIIGLQKYVGGLI